MNRKEIITALEEHYNVEAKYQGVPSLNYTIEINGETYTIDKNSKITAPDGNEAKLEELISKGLPDENEVNREEPILKDLPDEDEIKLDEPISLQEAGDFKFDIAMEGHTGKTLRNILNMIYSKQVLIKKVFELEEDIVDKDFIIELNENTIETIDDFRTALTGTKIHGIEFTDEFITFTLYSKPEKLKAYSKFLINLNKMALKLKNASIKPVQTENEKFAMRVWLIRLGFVGDEFKEERKILLKDLDGNAAFRYSTNKKIAQ